jgi:hypothetical protein
MYALRSTRHQKRYNTGLGPIGRRLVGGVLARLLSAVPWGGKPAGLVAAPGAIVLHGVRIR